MIPPSSGKMRDDCAIVLRASVNTGPCIAVNLNSGIDYFGGTVNIAAKLQACADAGQIAISPATLSAPGVQEMLRERGVSVERRRFEHRALAAPLDVRVWDVHAAIRCQVHTRFPRDNDE